MESAELVKEELAAVEPAKELDCQQIQIVYKEKDYNLKKKKYNIMPNWAIQCRYKENQKQDYLQSVKQVRI